jgi:hypothetical protein
VPDKDTWLIVILGPPEFDNVTDCVLLLPTGTLPKLMLEGVTVSCPVPATACEPKAKKVEKRKSRQNPCWIPLRPGPEYSTA